MYIEINDKMKNGKQYNGNTKKFGATVNGIDCIIKYPKDDDMSVYCEYIASRFIKALGIPCHTVHLGIYKDTIVNVMEDFTFNTNISLHSYKDTKQSSEDTDISVKEYTYADVLYLMDNHLKLSEDAKVEARARFWQMFICDAILANRDRHWGNWGYVSNGKSYRFAPLYDNGACLFPGVNQAIAGYKDETTRKEFIHERVFVFPASLFKIRRPDRAYRTNYEQMFKDLRTNKTLAKQVRDIKQKFTWRDIYEIALNIVSQINLPNEYKRFYVEIITMRYRCIILRHKFDKAYTEIENLLGRG